MGLVFWWTDRQKPKDKCTSDEQNHCKLVSPFPVPLLSAALFIFMLSKWLTFTPNPVTTPDPRLAWKRENQ